MSKPVFSKTSASVLVTDIPCTESDRRCYRDGMTADGIIRLYREEYRVEHCIRFTKSGVGIDQVFLQTPSRERAMMFVETPQGKEIDLFETTDALQINPRLLLGYLES